MKIISFLILSIPVIIISWKSLTRIKSHGFYRFFAWECILGLFVWNITWWFDDPFSPRQIISWILLFGSVYPVVAGTLLLSRIGKANKSREDTSLYGFEKTTKLVDTGIYKFIRHPLYCSLILLTWGILLKNITLFLLIISVLSTVLLYFTARSDEKECLIYFGENYREYMKKTKMFVPFLF